MKQSKVKNENHINIQGWMINELKLKGAELIIYAIIYGFSQDGQSKFTGSLQYLADWTNSTKQNCMNHLKSLLEKDLIEKEELEINNNKYCKYNAKLDTIQNFCIGSQKNCMGSQNFCTNNINYNIEDKTKLDKSNLVNNVENTKIVSKKDLILNENIKCIIDYLNETAGTKYKYSTKGTVNLLKARFKEGYQLDDFYDVIDKKWKDWRNTEFEQYMRPSTLFGNKFENYLNSTIFKGKPKTSYGSKPSFDNTINHDVGNKKITDEELDKMTLEEKINYVSNLALADMTLKQKEFFNNYCLARDENGNLLKF